MEIIIKLAAQILFALAAIVFTIYSIMGIYALNNYGYSKHITQAVSFVYSLVAISLLVWGCIILFNL